MKLLFIALYDILKYLKTKGNKKELKSFLYAFFQINFITLFGTLTAPVFWPIYYKMRNYLFNKIGLELSVYEYNNKYLFNFAKDRLNFVEYFIFLYGDKYSPKCEKLPEFFNIKHKGKSWFWKYFLFSAIRNPFFNYHYCYMQTEDAVFKDSAIKVIIDERIEQNIHSDGLADVESGKYFFWRSDFSGNPYFCYRNNTKKTMFYFEYCELEKLDNYDFLKCRLEIGLRKIK